MLDLHADDIARWEAPASWKAIDFLSDLHLSDETPRTFDALKAHLRTTPADAVVLLGDVFEVWVGDDARLEGFEARCTQAFAEAAAHRTLAFMAGNRDFLVGEAMLRDAGLKGLCDPTLLLAFGRRLLLTHGDALCVDDVDYQRFRAMVRNPAWQQALLAKPLAERRAIAAAMRRQSRAHQAAQRVETSADVDTATALAWLSAADAPLMIHGHTHRPDRHALDDAHERIVLSDWDHDHALPPRGDVLRLSVDGLVRLTSPG